MEADPRAESILRTELLCQTITGFPVPMLTITDDVRSFLSAEERFRLSNLKNGVLKKTFREKYMQARKLVKQMKDSSGKVANLLEAAFEEEIRSFFEQQADNFST